MARWALLLVAVAACSTETPVSPTPARPAVAALASKQSTTSSTMLFYGAVPALAGDANYHVFSMNDDGTNVRQLTTIPAQQPTWAPDGKHILFADLAGQIQVMNADGTAMTRLTAPPPNVCGDDAPESFGKQVVFMRLCSDASLAGLYLMEADGTGLTQLDHSAYDFPGPSPKGGAIVYPSAGDLWLLDVATGGKTNLTKTPSFYEYNPAFSPSGKQIAFVYGAAIAVMNADGTGLVQVTTPPAPKLDGNPRWSPDGKRITFSRGVFNSEAGTFLSSDILVMNADGTGVTDLTTQTLGANHVVYSSAWTK